MFINWRWQISVINSGWIGIMSRSKNKRGHPHDSKGRSVGRGRHVRLYHWMLDSVAWKNLSPGACALLIAVWKRYNGNNNGCIPFSVREAATEINVSKNIPSKLFQELIEKGFLKVVRNSNFDLKVRRSREWKLTAVECGDVPASKDFMHWRPAEKQNTVPREGTSGPINRDARNS